MNGQASFEQTFPAALVARELGIQVLAEDVPRLVAALQNAYGAGVRDGAVFEREACCGPDVTNSADIGADDAPHTVVRKYCAAIRARGAA